MQINMKRNIEKLPGDSGLPVVLRFSSPSTLTRSIGEVGDDVADRRAGRRGGRP